MHQDICLTLKVSRFEKTIVRTTEECIGTGNRPFFDSVLVIENALLVDFWVVGNS
jgi:hypothetical protein